MLQIDTKTPLESLANGQWRTYKPGVSAKLRPCTRKNYRRLLSAARAAEAIAAAELAEKRAANPGVTYPDPEPIDINLETLNWIVMEWRGLVDQDGAPLPLTRAMLDLVAQVESNFADWAARESDLMLTGLIKTVDEQLGNSEASAAPQPDSPAEA